MDSQCSDVIGYKVTEQLLSEMLQVNACFYLVSACLCMQSTILFYKFCLSVCLSVCPMPVL